MTRDHFAIVRADEWSPVSRVEGTGRLFVAQDEPQSLSREPSVTLRLVPWPQPHLSEEAYVPATFRGE